MIDITETHCRMGKIANNLELHGDEHKTEFNIPILNVMLSKDQLNEFFADDVHASWFHTVHEVPEPREWCRKTEVMLKEKYEGATVQIAFGGGGFVDFSNCKMKDVTLTAQMGGFTQMDFTLQLLPGLGRENIELQENQHSEIQITISDAKIAAKKKSKQTELPLDVPSEEEELA